MTPSFRGCDLQGAHRKTLLLFRMPFVPLRSEPLFLWKKPAATALILTHHANDF